MLTNLRLKSRGRKLPAIFFYWCAYTLRMPNTLCCARGVASLPSTAIVWGVLCTSTFTSTPLVDDTEPLHSPLETFLRATKIHLRTYPAVPPSPTHYPTVFSCQCPISVDSWPSARPPAAASKVLPLLLQRPTTPSFLGRPKPRVTSDPNTPALWPLTTSCNDHNLNSTPRRG